MSGPTPAMRRRSLRSEADERAWVIACLSGNGYPPDLFDAKVEHRMAEHAARCAWAEVEYAAWRSGNAVGMTGHRPEDPRTMEQLVAAAYEATNVMVAFSGLVLLLEARDARAAR